jgi:hypothetical protein
LRVAVNANVFSDVANEPETNLVYQRQLAATNGDPLPNRRLTVLGEVIVNKRTRALILGTTMLIGAGALIGSAQAVTVDEVAAQYSALGYQVTEIELKDNGVIEIEAVYEGVKVEIEVDAATGEVISMETEGEDPSGSGDDDPSSDSDSEDSDEDDSDDDEESDDDSDDDEDSASDSGSDD